MWSTFDVKKGGKPQNLLSCYFCSSLELMAWVLDLSSRLQFSTWVLHLSCEYLWQKTLWVIMSVFSPNNSLAGANILSILSSWIVYYFPPLLISHRLFLYLGNFKSQASLKEDLKIRTSKKDGGPVRWQVYWSPWVVNEKVTGKPRVLSMIHTSITRKRMVFLLPPRLTWSAIYWSQIFYSHKWPNVSVHDVKGKPCNFG